MTAVILELPRNDDEPPRPPQTPIGRLRALSGWVGAQLAAERERFVLWLPAFIGLGIALYFLLPAEPPIVVGLIIGPLIIAPVMLVPPDRRRRLLVPLIAIWAGFVAGTIRTELVSAPVLQRELYAEITGKVRWLEPLRDGRLRLVIDVQGIDRLKPAETPERVRISLRGVTEWPAIGDLIAVKASLSPPAGPVAPGAYDYARVAWFKGIGAVGYGGNTLRVVTPAPRADNGIARWFARLRVTIEARIHKALPQREAAIATALVVGARGGIAEADNKAMQDAGVSHVLSISGLHIALVAGLVFFVLRGGLALIEPLALRWPIKKIAAFAALAATAFYVGISDGSAPIVRSFIMFAVAILAVLIDRPAISLRTVAFAAGIILLAAPESLLDPSFQMSFAAVIGLIAAYEWYARRRGDRRDRDATDAPRWPWLARSIVATGVTSLIAETATAPFAAYHFNQFQGYGLIANEIVVPLLGFVIMPLGALSVVLMPFGLEHWPLQAMGLGIDQMLAVAHWTASLPGAVTYLTAWPAAALVIIVVGGLWLALWRKPWRLAGIPIALVGLTLGLTAPGLDVFVGEEGDRLAFRVRSDNGRWNYGLMGVRPTSYRGEAWLSRLGADPAAPLAASALVKCDALGCIVPVARDRAISVVRDGRALAEECASAEVLISLTRVVGACDAPRIVLDPPQLRFGAVGLRLNGATPRLERAAQGARPWRHGFATTGNDN